MILTLCSAPIRVKFLESHVACILAGAQRKFPKEWTPQAIGKLLQDVEDNGFNIDATEVFHRMGKELEDPEVLGQLVREYLLATGEKDSFNCRCRTAECQCPVSVDEGIAFIVFAGLERKMNWDEESKLKFFRSATETLWTPDVLTELGNLITDCVQRYIIFSWKSTVSTCKSKFPSFAYLSHWLKNVEHYAFSQSEPATTRLFNQSSTNAKPEAGWQLIRLLPCLASVMCFPVLVTDVTGYISFSASQELPPFFFPRLPAVAEFCLEFVIGSARYLRLISLVRGKRRFFSRQWSQKIAHCSCSDNLIEWSMNSSMLLSWDSHYYSQTPRNQQREEN